MAARRPVISAIACAAAALWLLCAALTPAAPQQDFVAASLRGGSRAPSVAAASFGSSLYEYNRNVYPQYEFGNEIGYFPDGTAMNKAGNALNHPETIGPDLHQDGSPLPEAKFMNSIGYFPDGTAYNKAGNAVNHPETIGPDLHQDGAPLPVTPYAADIGYFVDGTDVSKAGNALNHA
mmetsp:Transcript_26427/g.54497  ORF Transcript_26427/g.54497 Transcript_26427/m.54497 type:complete len:178 (+) Transcript_26427:83-616(+)